MRRQAAAANPHGIIDASSGETSFLMSGFHDTPGWNDLPVEPVS